MNSRLKEMIRNGVVDPFHAARYHGGGGKGGAPAAPDYRGAAMEEAAAGKENLTQQTWANRPTINTPWGQQTWTAEAGTDPSTGQSITNWTQNLNLTPEQQAALDSQQRIQQGRSGAAETLLGQASGAFQTPFDWDGLPTNTGEAAQAGNVEAAQRGIYDQMRQMLQPGRQEEQAALDTKLANMGLSMGGAANRKANMQLADQWGAQDRQMLGQALSEGRAQIGQQFSQDQSQIEQQERLRAGDIAEQAQRRGMPLNELNALLTGQQVNMPQMPQFNTAGVAQGPRLLDATNMAGQYGMNASQMGGGADVGQLAGSAMGAAAMAGMF